MIVQGYSKEEVFGVRLAVEEALVNALYHGNNGDHGKAVRFRYIVTGRQVLAQIADEGRGFDPRTVPDARDPENWERASGRGLLLIRSFMSWVRFNQRGNRITMCKQRDRARAGQHRFSLSDFHPWGKRLHSC